MSRRRRIPDTGPARAAWYAAAPDVHAPCPPGAGCPECADALGEWQAMWSAERPGWVESDQIEAAARSILVEQYTASIEAVSAPLGLAEQPPRLPVAP